MLTEINRQFAVQLEIALFKTENANALTYTVNTIEAIHRSIVLDALASLKDRKFISLNSDGSFTITELAREILWSSNIPIWGRVLRLLQIKSCSLNEIVEIIRISEDTIMTEIEKLRKEQLILMSPQRKDEKVIKMYEILPEGIEEIDKTETEGFNEKKFGESKQRVETTEIINQIIKEIESLEISEKKKENITQQIIKLKNKLEI